MKNIFIVFPLFFALSCQSQGASERKKMDVLFIGNSLTYYNGMPEMLKEMLADGGDLVNIGQSTFSGMSLSAHLDNTTGNNSISTLLN